MTYEELLDHIDAHVFTGDMLYDRSKRDQLAYFSKRWLTAIDRHIDFYPEEGEVPVEAPADDQKMVYILVEGGVVNAVKVRGLGDVSELTVVVDDLDDFELDPESRPDIIAMNGGELPPGFETVY